LSDKVLTKDVSSKLNKAPLKHFHQERGQQNFKPTKVQFKIGLQQRELIDEKNLKMTRKQK